MVYKSFFAVLVIITGFLARFLYIIFANCLANRIETINKRIKASIKSFLLTTNLRSRGLYPRVGPNGLYIELYML